MNRVQQLTGAEPILYTTFTSFLNNSLTSRALWARALNGQDPQTGNPSTGIWPTWAFWQYAIAGTPGVSGGVDQDVFNGTPAQFQNYVLRGITQWRSVHSHNGVGALGIVLNATASGSGPTGPTTEPRSSGGIGRIEVDFDGPVTAGSAAAVSIVGRATTGCPACTLGPPVSYSLSSLQANGTNGIALVINNGLPDAGCYTISLGPGTIVQNIVGDTDCNVRGLIGNVNVTANSADGVSLSDALLTKARIGQPVNAASASFDVTCDGNITSADALLVKARVGNTALCP